MIGVGSITAGYVLSALLPKYPNFKTILVTIFCFDCWRLEYFECVAVSQAVPFLPECVVYGLTCLGKNQSKYSFLRHCFNLYLEDGLYGKS